MSLSSYKAILFDVDKTLTNLDKEITQSTREALRSLQTKGFIVGVCTGRHYATLYAELADVFSPTTSHVLCSGAQVVQTDGTVLFEHPLDSQLVVNLIELSKVHDVRIVIQHGRQFFGNEKAVAYRSRYALAGQPIPDVLPLRDVPTLSVPLVIMGNLTADCIADMNKLPITYKLMVGYDGNYYTDITAKGVTKAFGIHEWCRINGVLPSEIIGVGDSVNDIEFLQTAGYAVVMGNATEEIQALADEVIGRCDEDAIAQWIHTLAK